MFDHVLGKRASDFPTAPLRNLRGKDNDDVQRLAFELASGFNKGMCAAVETKEDVKNQHIMTTAYGIYTLMMATVNKVMNQAKEENLTVEAAKELMTCEVSDLSVDIIRIGRAQIEACYDGTNKQQVRELKN